MAIALSGSAGTGAGALTVGVSIGRNQIGNEVRAFIDNTGLDENTVSLPSGGVLLSADSTATIQARSCAASIAVAAGQSGGLALSGGGAVAHNAIYTDTNAYLKGVDLVCAGDVVLLATNTSLIGADIDAWSTSVGIGVSGGGAAAAIGAALARNYIGYTWDGTKETAQVRAYIENSSVDAGGDVALTVVADETIHAEVTAVAAAVAGSAGDKGIGLGGAGSGADAQNKIATQVKAYIDGDYPLGTAAGPSEIFADTVTLVANDVSSITAHVAAVAVAASFAPKGALSLAIGVSLAKNEIYNEVEAYIQNVDKMVARRGPVAVVATEGATINAGSVAVAVSVAVAQVGIALSGAGANATNLIGNRVHSYIADSTVETSYYDYTTQDQPDQLSWGERVKLDDGEIVKYTGPDLTEPVDLSEQDYTDEDLWAPVNDGQISVLAYSISSITANVDAVSASVAGGGTAVAGSIGVTIAINQIGFETPHPNESLAYIDNSTVTSAGDIQVKATSAETIVSDSVATSIAVAVGGSGFAGAGAGTGTWNQISTSVHAYLQDTDATASGNIDVKAESTSEVTKARAVGRAIALALASEGVAISVAASTVENTISNDVRAYVSESTSYDYTTDDQPARSIMKSASGLTTEGSTNTWARPFPGPSISIRRNRNTQTRISGN